MEILSWIQTHWIDSLQTFAILSGFLLTIHSNRRDENTRKISNLLSIKQQYMDIWGRLYQQPGLARVLQSDADIKKTPVTLEEGLFVKFLVLHLDTVFRSMEKEMFVSLEGLDKDITEFFSLPIPHHVWEKIKSFQNKDFVDFIELNRKRK